MQCVKFHHFNQGEDILKFQINCIIVRNQDGDCIKINKIFIGYFCFVGNLKSLQKKIIETCRIFSKILNILKYIYDLFKSQYVSNNKPISYLDKDFIHIFVKLNIYNLDEILE